jgi:hypothetical protein
VCHCAGLFCAIVLAYCVLPSVQNLKIASACTSPVSEHALRPPPLSLVAQPACDLHQAAAAGASEATRSAMAAHFKRGCELEWMFWDAAASRQDWPTFA